MKKKEEPKNLTIGELKELIKGYPNDMKIHFDGLYFVEFKDIDSDLVQMRFNNLQDY